MINDQLRKKLANTNFVQKAQSTMIDLFPDRNDNRITKTETSSQTAGSVPASFFY